MVILGLSPVSKFGERMRTTLQNTEGFTPDDVARDVESHVFHPVIEYLKKLPVESGTPPTSEVTPNPEGPPPGMHASNIDAKALDPVTERLTQEHQEARKVVQAPPAPPVADPYREPLDSDDQM